MPRYFKQDPTLPQGFSDSFRQRFWSKVNKNGPIPAHKPELGPCWEWLGKKNRLGYGLIHPGKQFGKKAIKAHRAALVLSKGVMPERCVLHSCDNPSCVRESHLFEGTLMDNYQDMVRKGRRSPEAHGCQRGERSHFHVLTEAEAVRIIQLYATGRFSQRQLGAMFGVIQQTIQCLVAGKSWKYLHA